MGVLSVEVGGLVWTVESLYYEGLVWLLTDHDDRADTERERREGLKDGIISHGCDTYAGFVFLCMWLMAASS